MDCQLCLDHARASSASVSALYGGYASSPIYFGAPAPVSVKTVKSQRGLKNLFKRKSRSSKVIYQPLGWDWGWNWGSPYYY